MDTFFPDRETIYSALALAGRAPSIHNSQPWRWQVGDETLHLYADRDKHLPNTDPDSRDLLLSCGASLHHAVTALAAMGWNCKVHRFPNPAEPDHLAAIEVYPQPASELDVALAAAIPKRRTDRRLYSDWRVPQSDIALMGARAARMGVMLRQVESLPNLQQIVARAVWQHVKDYNYLSELSTWSGRHASVAGVPARSTPRSYPGAPIPGRFFAGPALAQPEVSPVDDAAVVLALGTKDDSPLSRLRAGEATSMVLLTATAAGLASCPVTEPLEIAETRAEVKADVFGDSGYPQMMLRIGWAPVNADPLPSTPRRSVSDIVDDLE
jgi:nitroreductase